MLKNNLSTLIISLLAGITISGPILGMSQKKSAEEISQHLPEAIARIADEAKKATKFCNLLDKVHTLDWKKHNANTRWSLNKYSDGTYELKLLYNPEDQRYTLPTHIFAIYHELGHLANGDLTRRHNARTEGKILHKTKLAGTTAIATLAGGILPISIAGRKPNGFWDFALISMISCCSGLYGYLWAKHELLSQDRAEEHNADLFACNALLKQKNIVPIIHEFFCDIEDHQDHGDAHEPTHPPHLERAQIKIEFLEKNNLNLLALPIPAQDAKKFNAYLKQYFPDAYAQCIKKYA